MTDFEHFTQKACVNQSIDDIINQELKFDWGMTGEIE